MSDDSEEVEHDTEEIANMLVWPGPIEEGMVTAGGLREIQENEDRLRRLSRAGVTRPSFTAGQKLYGMLNVGLVISSLVFFVWLLWIFTQSLAFGLP